MRKKSDNLRKKKPHLGLLRRFSLEIYHQNKGLSRDDRVCYSGRRNFEGGFNFHIYIKRI